MKIHFAVRLAETDFRRIQMLAVRGMWLVVGAIFILMLILNLLGGMGQALLRNPVDAIIKWMPIVFVIPIIIALQWFMFRHHWKNNPSIQLPVEGVVSDEGISWNVVNLISSNFSWALLARYRESTSLVLVYQSLNQVLYFPRHYFTSDEDWAAFRQR